MFKLRFNFGTEGNYFLINRYDDNSSAILSFCLKNHTYHRDEDKPSLYYSNGEFFGYFKNGKPHRLNNPAKIWNKKDYHLEEYWVNGNYKPTVNGMT